MCFPGVLPKIPAEIAEKLDSMEYMSNRASHLIYISQRQRNSGRITHMYVSTVYVTVSVVATIPLATAEAILLAN